MQRIEDAIDLVKAHRPTEGPDLSTPIGPRGYGNSRLNQKEKDQ